MADQSDCGEDIELIPSDAGEVVFGDEEQQGLDEHCDKTIGEALAPVRTTEAQLEKARRLLYLSHFGGQFSQSAWQFALILFLAAFSNYQSLLLISTYGLVSQMSVCLFGASAGRFVDGAERLYAARCFIWTQNCGVLMATALCYLLLKMHPVTEIVTTGDADLSDDMKPQSWLEREFKGVPLDPLSIALLVGVHLFGSLAAVLDKGFLVAIERDWVVIMSQVANFDATVTEPNKTWLSVTNVMMKQIDLSCQVVAPAIAGFVVGAFDTSSSAAISDGVPLEQGHHSDLSVAAILVGAFNVASLVIEYICTARIYNLIPPLRDKLAPATRESSSLVEIDLQLQIETSSSKKATSCRLCQVPSGIKTYLGQPISMAGLGLSLLYLNALSFGGIMTGYLVWRGMRLETVGIWRGISAAIGLMGTFVFHFSASRITLVSTGMWSIVYQFSCLSICFGSLFVTENYYISMVMLIGGTCASRIGLWVFDITVTQLMQEFIPDGIRGVVGGTQQSLNALFFLLSFAIGIVFPDPQEFNIYVASGYVAVGLAMFLYMFGIFRKRDLFLTSIEQSHV